MITHLEMLGKLTQSKYNKKNTHFNIRISTLRIYWVLRYTIYGLNAQTTQNDN